MTHFPRPAVLNNRIDDVTTELLSMIGDGDPRFPLPGADPPDLLLDEGGDGENPNKSKVPTLVPAKKPKTTTPTVGETWIVHPTTVVGEPTLDCFMNKPLSDNSDNRFSPGTGPTVAAAKKNATNNGGIDAPKAQKAKIGTEICPPTCPVKWAKTPAPTVNPGVQTWVDLIVDKLYAALLPPTPRHHATSYWNHTATVYCSRKLPAFRKWLTWILAEGVSHTFDEPFWLKKWRKNTQLFCLTMVDYFMAHVMGFPTPRADDYPRPAYGTRGRFIESERLETSLSGTENDAWIPLEWTNRTGYKMQGILIHLAASGYLDSSSIQISRLTQETFSTHSGERTLTGLYD